VKRKSSLKCVCIICLIKQTSCIVLKYIMFSLARKEDDNKEAQEEDQHSQRQNDGDDYHGSAACFKTAVYLLVIKD